MSEHYVYVAEAYKDGERIEQIVHKNKRDAREDIQITAHRADEYEIQERRLWMGEDTEWHIERETETVPERL